MDLGQYATLGNGDLVQKLVELLVVAHGERQVPRHHPLLFVVTRSVAAQLEHLRREVLERGSRVDGGSGAHAPHKAMLLKATLEARHGEDESRLGGAAHVLLPVPPPSTHSRHECCARDWCTSYAGKR